MKNGKTILAIALIGLVFTFGCASTSYMGNWNYTVTGLPDGTLTGQLIISETDNGFNCRVKSSDYAEFDFESCDLVENVLKGHYFDDMGTRIEISGMFDEDQLTGFVNVQGEQFPLQLEKAEE